MLVTTTSYGLDGQYHRYGRTFVAQVWGHDLEAGDVISITFAHTQAPTVAEINSIAVAVDADGDGSFQPLADSPLLRVEPADFVTARVLAPSQVLAHEPFAVEIVALDAYQNATGTFQPLVEFHSTDPDAILPPAHALSGVDGGHKSFTVTLSLPGVQVLTVTTQMRGFSQTLRSNPILVESNPPTRTIYWGDIHSHSEMSHDGIGQAEGAFAYAREIADLDFYALTDHAHADDGSQGLTDGEWADVQSLVEGYYQPGAFVTFLGYEWSGSAPYGHRNIIYRSPSGTLFRRQDYPTLPQLWQVIRDSGEEVLTIPHHTAITWGSGLTSFAAWEPWGASPYVSWAYADPDLQRVAEIYSLHGSSEYLGNPLAYENVGFVPGSTSNSGPYYLQDSWVAGQKLGITASSDNHTAHPGLEYSGLTAVYAGELTREAVFEALAAGRTYATTGARILLEFKADGHWPGETYWTAEPPRLALQVAGTANLEYVEIVKYDGRAYRSIYYLSNPDTSQVSLRFVDQTLADPSLYYVRVKQENQIDGRDVMAWSSPIWITPTANLAVAVSDGRAQAQSGDLLTYTIVYRNAGLVTAENVYVTDTMPLYTSLPSWPEVQAEEVAGETWIRFGLGDVQPGQSGSLTVVLLVDPDLPWGSTTVTNTVSIGSTTTDVDLTDNVALDRDQFLHYHRTFLPWAASAPREIGAQP